jgi:hypothetical protein
MRTSNEIDLRLGHHPLNEGVALPCLAGELPGRIDGGIHRPTQRFHGGPERLENSGERRGAYDHEIDVAAGALLTPGDGSIDESHPHAIPECGEPGTQELRGSGGLRQQAFQLREYGGLRVGSEADRNLARITQDESQVDQTAQLTMRRPGARSRLAGDLAQMKPLVRVLEQKGEHGCTTAAEQCIGERSDISCSHGENNSTQPENRTQPG